MLEPGKYYVHVEGDEKWTDRGPFDTPEEAEDYIKDWELDRIAAELGKQAVVIEGNPTGAPLHEALAEAAQVVDYEAAVVETAAEEIEDPAIASAAEDQAEAMHEAADALDEAAEAAAETAAEVFNETGIPSDENPETVIAGNPADPGEPLPNPDPEVAALAGNPFAPRRLAVLRGNPSTSHWFNEGRERGAELHDQLVSEYGSIADVPEDDFLSAPLSGEFAGESIPEIFGSWEEATEDNMDAYEAGYWDAMYGNPIDAPIAETVATTVSGGGTPTEIAERETVTEDEAPSITHWFFRPWRITHG